MRGPRDWQLEGFHARLIEWVGDADPPQWIVERVANWLPTLALDPYHQAVSEPGAGGRLYAREVPDAVRCGLTVVCLYSIDPDARVVRCSAVCWRDDPPQVGH